MLQSKGVGACDLGLGADKHVTWFADPFGAIAAGARNAGASCRSIDRLVATQTAAVASALGQSSCPGQNANHGVFPSSALNDLSALLAN